MLEHNETLCLKNMMMCYKITLTDAESNNEPRAVACSMIKEFLGYCYLKNQISDDDMNYVNSMQILGSRVNHKAFYDILERKYL